MKKTSLFQAKETGEPVRTSSKMTRGQWMDVRGARQGCTPRRAHALLVGEEDDTVTLTAEVPVLTDTQDGMKKQGD